MPRYDYTCSDEDCAWRGDIVVPFDDRDAQTCPREHDDEPCGKPLVRAELSGVPAQMKMNWRS